MQKDAEANGGLHVYPEFSWLYPWFRLHFAWEYNGQTMLDIGIAPLPFADTASFPDAAFKEEVSMALLRTALNIFISVAVTQVALWAASSGGLAPFAAILIGYIIYKLVNLESNMNSLENLWISLVSTIVSLAISVYTGLCSFLPSSLQALAAGAASIKNAAFAFLCKIIMIPVNLFLLNIAWNQIVLLGGV
jgi:hypothetical protein